VADDPHELLALRRLSRRDDQLRGLWNEYGADILAEWIEEHFDDSRPWAWTRFGEPR
jgi:hypothetical protein